MVMMLPATGAIHATGWTRRRRRSPRGRVGDAGGRRKRSRRHDATEPSTRAAAPMPIPIGAAAGPNRKREMATPTMPAATPTMAAWTAALDEQAVGQAGHGHGLDVARCHVGASGQHRIGLGAAQQRDRGPGARSEAHATGGPGGAHQGYGVGGHVVLDVHERGGGDGPFPPGGVGHGRQ